MDEELTLNAKYEFAQGNFKECVKIFDQILAEEPDNLIAMFTRGTAKFRDHDYQGAVEDFTLYIDHKKNNEKVFCSRGNAYLCLEQTDEAMADFNKALDINPQYPTAYFSRSELFRRLGEEEQAEDDKITGDRLQRQLSQAYYETQGVMFQNF